MQRESLYLFSQFIGDTNHLPIVLLPSEDCLISNWGRLDIYPSDYPHIPESRFSNLTDDEVISIRFFREEKVEQFSKHFRIGDWLSINQLAPVSIESWLGCSEWERKYGLSVWVKEALVFETNRVVEARNRSMQDEKKKMELAANEGKGQLQFPSPANAIQRYL